MQLGPAGLCGMPESAAHLRIHADGDLLVHHFQRDADRTAAGPPKRIETRQSRRGEPPPAAGRLKRPAPRNRRS